MTCTFCCEDHPHELSEHNKRVYVYEEGEWNVKGCFQAALEDNDDISWGNENGEYNLLIAIVSIYLNLYSQCC